MKRAFIVAAIVAIASTVSAEAFKPNANYSYLLTKSDKTHDLVGKEQFRFRTSGAITYKFNGTGAAFTLPANAEEGPFKVAQGKSSIVFSAASSAGITISVQDY